MSDDKDVVLEAGGCLLGLLLLVPMALFSGWVASFLWRWFVTPTFGIPVPNFATIAGLMALWKYFAWTSRKSPEEPALNHAVRSTVEGLMLGGVVLALGYILYLIAS